VDRLRAVRARVNAIPSELEVEIQAADVMNDESVLGPDLMQYESGRHNMKAKRVKLTAPVRLTSSGNRAATKRFKRNGRKYGRSDRMVLDFGDIDLEEATDGSERGVKKKARFHSFNLRRLRHNGSRLRFSRPNADGFITVLKGAKRDAEREVKVPVYNATYSGTGKTYKSTSTVAKWKRVEEVQYDRDLRRKIDKRAEQRTVEAYNRKTTKERKLKAGAKRDKEEFERFCLKNVSVQSVRVFEDQREEREALRCQQTKTGKSKQPNSGRCRFVVDMGETMCGNALNTGFQFARSKVLNDKAWSNTFDQVQADWGTRKHLSRRWACILTRRMRHRKLQAIGMEDQKNKRRVFLFSMRAVMVSGAAARHLSGG
jgi:hypothetical protein